MADTRLAGPAVEVTAGEDLDVGKVVAVIGGEAFYASKENIEHRGAILGIVVRAANTGSLALVQVYGPLTNIAWTWTPDLPIYVGDSGELTQTYPAGGYVQQVARAFSSDLIFVDIQTEDYRQEKLSLTFGFNDATPEQIGVVPANKLIKKVELHITEAFDGANPSLAVGFDGDTDALMGVANNIPEEEASYFTHPNVSYGEDKTILLTIVGGSGGSVGSGLVVVTFQR